MRSIVSLLLLGGCFGAGDGIFIGHATGAYKKWDTAACTCDFEDDSYFGPGILLGCMPMFTGEASTSLYLGLPPVPNTLSRVNVADYFDDYATGNALVELSSDDPSAVWIDALVMHPHGCDPDAVYEYASDVCEPWEGGTLENVRMYCEGR